MQVKPNEIKFETQRELHCCLLWMGRWWTGYSIFVPRSRPAVTPDSNPFWFAVANAVYFPEEPI